MSLNKTIVLDIIHYIYPPASTKLKSTRKSAWLNPVVDNDDALRLKGFKLIEETHFEAPWKMVANAATFDEMRRSKKHTTPIDPKYNNLNN